MDREIYGLPTCLCGLSIPCLDAGCNFEFSASKLLCAQLVDSIVHQSTFLVPDNQNMAITRLLLNNSRITRLKNSADSFQEKLRTISLARDKGASRWLKVLLLGCHVLNKEEFRDSFALRYDKYIPIFRVTVHVESFSARPIRWIVKLVASLIMLVMMLLEI